MLIRFKVPFDNGTIKLAAGEETDAFDGRQADRFIRSGLAEAITGNRSVNHFRARAGLAPIPRRGARK